MANPFATGRCKLTGSVGRFVRSHLIPEALTKLSRTGERMIEAGIGIQPILRPTSWYDRALVVRHGEDILSRIDWRGIEELRLHRLVWSSWGEVQELPADDLVIEGGVPHLRWIDIADPGPLRIFFLSLAWRAGATVRPEFKFSRIDRDIVEDLRVRVANENPGAPEHYPIQLYQLVTRGAAHNRVPMLERKRVVNIDGSDAGLTLEYLRFYFDGLVAHVHLAMKVAVPKPYLRYSCVGFQRKTPIFAHRYEASRASADIMEMMQTVMKEQRVRGPSRHISGDVDGPRKDKKR